MNFPGVWTGGVLPPSFLPPPATLRAYPCPAICRPVRLDLWVQSHRHSTALPSIPCPLTCRLVRLGPWMRSDCFPPPTLLVQLMRTGVCVPTVMLSQHRQICIPKPLIMIIGGGARLCLPTFRRLRFRPPRPGIIFVIMVMFWSYQAHRSFNMRALSRNHVSGATCPRRTLATRLAGQYSRSHALGINGGGVLPSTYGLSVVIGTLPAMGLAVGLTKPYLDVW